MLKGSGLRAQGSGRRVRDLVVEVAEILSALSDARREAMDLIAALHGMPRHWPMLQSEEKIATDVRARVLDAARMRASGAPLAYAVGRADFRALTLHVDERVLIPRPETELLVDLVLSRARDGGGVALDIGTGSGAIAIALATEGKFDRVIASDISRDALDVASANAKRLGAKVEFFAGDLLAAVPSMDHGLWVIVSNPPYIGFDEIAQLPASVRDWEPAAALYSSANGMDTTSRLVRQAVDKLEPGGLLALEVDARRASLVSEQLATDLRYDNVTVELDLTGRERFVLANRRA